MAQTTAQREDFLTPRERAREEKVRNVCEEYKAIHAAFPDVPGSRIASYLAKKLNISLGMSRNILREHDLYIPQAN